jgi:hypothetical protein
MNRFRRAGLRGRSDPFRFMQPFESMDGKAGMDR